LTGTPSLATVATTGAYSDLTGTPTLATVATTGAYSDLSGTPTLGTAAALNVGTSASQVVQLDGSARLPAIDGSQLTNLPSGASALDDLSDVVITSASAGEVLRHNGVNFVDAQLDYSDLTGTPSLATVATTGAYSDLSGTPSLATVATTGAYSDLSGTPTLGTAAALNVGTSASQVVQLDGAAKLPAIDGSQLTNLPSGASAPNFTAVSNTSYTLTAANAPNIYIWYGAANTSTFTVTLPNATDVISDSASTNGNPVETFEIHVGRGYGGDITISANNGIDLLGDGVVTYSTTQTIKAGEWIKLIGWKTPGGSGRYIMNAPISGLTNLSDVNITSAATGEVLRYNGATWVDAQLAYSDLSGTPTLGTAAALNVGTSASQVVQLDGSAKLPAIDGSQLTNLPSGVTDLNGLSDVVITSASAGEVLRHNGVNFVDAQLAYSDLSGTPTLATVATTGAYSDLSGTPTLATVATTGAYSDLSGTPTLGTAAALNVGTSASQVVQLDGSARLPAIDGSQLTNLPSGASALDDLSDVVITSASAGEVLRHNGVNFVDAQLAYSDLSGTPSLATVATTGAYSDLTGTPSLATVATTGAYSDLTGTPTLGTAAALNVGTSASQVVQLDGSARLPAVDGSQLTNLPSSGGGFTYSAISSTTTAQASYHYSCDTSGGAFTLNLPALSGVTAGQEIRVKLATAGNDLTIDGNSTETIDGTQTYILNVAKSAVTLVAGNGTDWEVI
jgi:hypothetical protein